MNNAQLALAAAVFFRQPIEGTLSYSSTEVLSVADKFHQWLEDNSEVDTDAEVR